MSCMLHVSSDNRVCPVSTVKCRWENCLYKSWFVFDGTDPPVGGGGRAPDRVSIVKYVSHVLNSENEV